MSQLGHEWCHRLYQAKAAALLLYGRALGLGRAEAEDVLHDTFVALLRLTAAPRDPDHYVLRAYRNRAVNYHRSLWRRMLREWESRRWFETGGEDDPRELEAQRCLQRLPAEQREVIVLRIWHRRTFQEIAGLTGVSVNTAAGRYRYGMTKLRSAMERDQYGTDEILGKADGCLDPASPVQVP